MYVPRFHSFNTNVLVTGCIKVIGNVCCVLGTYDFKLGIMVLINLEMLLSYYSLYIYIFMYWLHRGICTLHGKED